MTLDVSFKRNGKEKEPKGKVSTPVNSSFSGGGSLITKKHLFHLCIIENVPPPAYHLKEEEKKSGREKLEKDRLQSYVLFSKA